MLCAPLKIGNVKLNLLLLYTNLLLTHSGAGKAWQKSLFIIEAL